MQMKVESVLKTEGLSKVYPGGISALEDCCLQISAGEIYGLLGPNGAGKTTLLRLILGFMRPSGGVARVLGFDCWSESIEVRKRVAFLPGDVRLFRQLGAREFLEFMANLRGTAPARGRDRGDYYAERLDLDLKRRISQMSTGMRQKLAIVATLSADVPFVILDEPTSSLDPTVRQTLNSLLRELQSAGRTILLSSHVLAEVEDLCQRVGIMRSGRLVIEQRIQDLRQQYRITARLAGSWISPPSGLNVTHVLSDGVVTMYSSSQLPDLLPWLAQLPLETLAIEPVGLRSVYEQIHAQSLSTGPGSQSLELIGVNGSAPAHRTAVESLPVSER
jgi:ABC-2 type transport system ATP-binding protein